MVKLPDIYDHGVWFVYDGDCPLCTSAAQALKIKESHGPLHIIDARRSDQPELMSTIKQRNYDLDQGMVIYHSGVFYHGQEALYFMALHSQPSGLYNRINRLLFRSKLLRKTAYPFMRGCRNTLIRLLGRKPIYNMIDKNSPTFKSVFKDDWDQLPPVLKKHYANRPLSKDEVIVEGKLNVYAHPMLRIFAPIIALIGLVPPYSQDNVPVKVTFKSDPNDTSFQLVRYFHFQDKKPYLFHSKMYCHQQDVVEVMKGGFCWRSDIFYDGQKVQLKHKGYAIKLFGKIIPLPITWLMGAGNATETAIDDDHFAMEVTVTHPLWGKIYGYNGIFRITKTL